MKILFQLTIEYLKKNKIMSLFYIIGVFISVLLLSSMIIFFNSSKDFQMKENQYMFGDYELTYYANEDREQIRKILPESNVEDEIRITEYGYIRKADDTYIKVNAMNQIPQKSVLHLQIGTYPSNENEIMVSKNYLDSHHLQIGDEISIEITSPRGAFPQKYTICGVYRSYLQNDDGDYLYHYIDQIGHEYAVSDEMMILNYSQKEQILLKGYLSLQGMGKVEIASLKQELFDKFINAHVDDIIVDYKYASSFSASLGFFIIMFVFVMILIHMITNMSFIIYRKKMNYIGMLKSIGATNKQLMACSIIESIFFAVVAIPLGLIICVLLMHFVLQYVSNFNQFELAPFPYELIVNWKDIIFIVLFDFMIIAIGNLLPIIRMKQYKTIDLLKDNLEDKAMKIKAYSTLEKVLGIEALLAKKNQMRNSKAVKSICFSIAFSIVLSLCGNYILNVVLTQFGDTPDPRYTILIGVSFMLQFDALINLICVIYSNIMLRKKENHILFSIGTEDSQLLRMLYFENGSVVIKGTLLGIMLGELVNYLFYKVLFETSGIDFEIQLPFVLLMIIIVVVIAMVIVFLSFISMKSEDMVETLKD